MGACECMWNCVLMLGKWSKCAYGLRVRTRLKEVRGVKTSGSHRTQIVLRKGASHRRLVATVVITRYFHVRSAHTCVNLNVLAHHATNTRLTRYFFLTQSARDQLPRILCALFTHLRAHACISSFRLWAGRTLLTCGACARAACIVWRRRTSLRSAD